MIAVACAALSLLAALPASAACSFKVLPIPIVMIGTRPTVTVKINDQDAHFLIDSGAAANVLSTRLAAGQTMAPPQSMTGAGGKTFLAKRVVVAATEFLGVTFKDQLYTVSDRLTGLDGVIGQPMLRRMDVEYDLRGGVIRLVRTEDCKNAEMTYWVRPGQAYSKISMAWTDRDDSHTNGVIFINGQKMRATFDTGAATSFITQAAAAKAGVHVTDPGVRPVGKGEGFDGEFDAWVGVFNDVKIGDEEIKSAPLEIGQSSASDFDVLLGADFFLSHHVYVSHIQDKIYFAYEGGPAFRPPNDLQTSQAPSPSPGSAP